MSRLFILLTLLTMATNSSAYCLNKEVPGITMVKLSIALKTMNGATITSLQCHKSMQVPLTAAFACVKLLGMESELKTTGGCFCYRNIAGTDRLSRHANGTAIDINPGLPIPQKVVECFESAGFKWGGRWINPDLMHFELIRK